MLGRVGGVGGTEYVPQGAHDLPRVLERAGGSASVWAVLKLTTGVNVVRGVWSPSSLRAAGWVKDGGQRDTHDSARLLGGVETKWGRLGYKQDQKAL